MVHGPVRRKYPPRPAGGPRDVDAPRRARFVQAFGWLALAGLLWGGLVGYVLGGAAGALLGGVGGVLILGVGGGGVVVLITDRVGGMARALYNPSGSSTPHQQGYSYPKSLAARGAYEEAVEAYQEFISRDPSDPEPYLAIARVLRDELGRFQDAARWLRRARREATMDPGREILVARELVELYRNKLGEPARAAPELARLAGEFPHTAEAEWARRELGELKEELARRNDVQAEA